MQEKNIYVFKSRTSDGHLTISAEYDPNSKYGLCSPRKVSNKGTIELSSEDLKRPLIKTMIKRGKDPECRKDRLVLVEPPKEPVGDAPNDSDDDSSS